MTETEDCRKSLRQLLAGIEARVARFPEGIAFVPSLRRISGLAAGRVTPAGTGALPVQRHWRSAVAGDPLGDILAGMATTFALGWRQNASYRTQPPHNRFLENYGYFEIAGPDAMLRTGALRLGLLVLGPATLYPEHCHPAEELYLPLGPGRWFKEGAGWSERKAGAVIHHPPMCRHATWSGARPLAAIYLWRGEIITAARIG
jgi:hypothetical protein